MAVIENLNIPMVGIAPRARILPLNGKPAIAI
jgi:hypothetical protein